MSTPVQNPSGEIFHKPTGAMGSHSSQPDFSNPGVCMVGVLAYIFGPLSKMIEAFIKSRQALLESESKSFALAGKTATTAQDATISGADLQRDQLITEAVTSLTNALTGLGIMAMSEHAASKFDTKINQLDEKVNNISEFQSKMAKDANVETQLLRTEDGLTPAERIAQEGLSEKAKLIKQKSPTAFDKPVDDSVIAELKLHEADRVDQHVEFSRDHLNKVSREKTALETQREQVRGKYYQANQLYLNSVAPMVTATGKSVYLHGIGVQEAVKQMYLALGALAQEIQKSSAGQADGFQQAITQIIQGIQKSVSAASAG